MKICSVNERFIFTNDCFAICSTYLRDTFKKMLSPFNHIITSNTVALTATTITIITTL
ncbi:hypothetical protein [Ilyomonas limi]|uniref:hypothetical protein n=1 Tax=Ilyomonas limi TaxID=2575867 RepID=UPI001485B436|nr:hypothetical protein [Ilyomonas limi]